VLARFYHYLLLSILAACLGNACNKENGEERQAVVVTVTADAPGYGADQVDDLVAKPVVTRLIGIPGVQRIRSRATAGRAVVWVDYALGTNVYKARQVTAGGLQLADPALPETVDLMLGPVLVPDQVMLVALSGRRPISELREVADRVVRPGLLTTPGVAEVIVTGGQVMQCRIIVSPDRMKAYSLTICELVSAVEQALDDDRVEPGTQEHVVREMGRLHVSSTLGE
jgi:HME family heavy-metal exporter